MPSQYDPQAYATLIHFTPRADVNPFTIDDGSSEGERWKEIMRPLVKAPGHHCSLWGHIIERTPRMLLITRWRTHDGWPAFRSSEGYSHLSRELQAISSTTLETRLFDFDGAPFDIHLKGYTALTEVQFAPRPPPKADADHIRGLIYKVGGVAGRSPYRSHPARGHVVSQEPANIDSATGPAPEGAITLLLQYWKSEEAEQKYKSSPAQLKPPGADPGETKLQMWERTVSEAGAENWDEVHCEFVPVPSAFQGEPWGT